MTARGLGFQIIASLFQRKKEKGGKKEKEPSYAGEFINDEFPNSVEYDGNSALNSVCFSFLKIKLKYKFYFSFRQNFVRLAFEVFK